MEPSRADAVSYYLVNKEDTLSAALRNTLVIENPKILVMSEQQVSALKIVPKPSSAVYTTPEQLSKFLDVDVATTEQLPYARKSKWREKEGGNDAKHGNRERDNKRQRNNSRHAGGKSVNIPANGMAESMSAKTQNQENDKSEVAGADSEEDGLEEDLADVDLLRAIEGAKSAEELLKVQAELDQQIAMHAPVAILEAQSDACGSADRESGLTPNVADMDIGNRCL